MTLLEAGVVFLTGAFLAATLLKIGQRVGETSSKSALSAARSVLMAATSQCSIALELASRSQTDYQVSRKMDGLLESHASATKTMTDLDERVQKMDVSLYNLQNVVAGQQPSRGRQRQAMESMGRRPVESPTPEIKVESRGASGLWGTKSADETLEVAPPASRTGADRLT